MSIQDTIDSIESNLSDAYGAVRTKSGTVPQNPNLANLTNAILSISGGDNPLIATTDVEMTALLISANNGKVVKFTGTSQTYTTDKYYLIKESV